MEEQRKDHCFDCVKSSLEKCILRLNASTAAQLPCRQWRSSVFRTEKSLWQYLRNLDSLMAKLNPIRWMCRLPFFRLWVNDSDYSIDQWWFVLSHSLGEFNGWCITGAKITSPYVVVWIRFYFDDFVKILSSSLLCIW